MALKTTTEHICFRDKEITDMHKILTGNGNPELGLCNQVSLIGERQSVVIKTLKDIDRALSGSAEIEKEIEIQRRIREAEDSKNNIKFNKKTVIIGLVLYALMLIGTVTISVISLSNSNKDSTEITNTTRNKVK